MCSCVFVFEDAPEFAGNLPEEEWVADHMERCLDAQEVSGFGRRSGTEPEKFHDHGDGALVRLIVSRCCRMCRSEQRHASGPGAPCERVWLLARGAQALAG